MVRQGSKNRHLKNLCLIKIGPRAQNLLTILGSIVTVIGGPIWFFKKENLNFDGQEGMQISSKL